jgi:tRNA-2-methylthio-N6-dimethylallyladenosine synthase
MRTYYLRSFGCQMNEHDAERIRFALEGEGLAAVRTPGEADVLVYNTCTVRHSADERLAGHLSEAARLKREHPERVVLVTGCLPQAEQHGLFTRFPFVDGALGPQNLHRLPELLAAAVKPAGSAGGSPGRAGFFADGPHVSGALPGKRARRHQAWVQIMSGCTNFCSYCIVPYVRGPERSREAADILTEVTALAADGVREVTLLGQNVNAYGLDLRRAGREDAPDFASLLRTIDARGGVSRVRFMTSHPKDLLDDLVTAIATLPSVCEHVHLPLQSGSDAVLKAMRRSYTTEAYLERVAALRAAVPGIHVTTDLIAGFPGETEDDFAGTLDVVARARFDGAFTFVYSPREGTAAADLAGQVPDDVRRARVGRLIAATQELALASRRASLGTTVEVLVEGPSRRGDELRGRTRQNVTVNFAGAVEAGAIVEVEIEAATSTTLRGRLTRA